MMGGGGGPKGNSSKFTKASLNVYDLKNMGWHYGSLESNFKVMSLDMMEGFWRF